MDLERFSQLSRILSRKVKVPTRREVFIGLLSVSSLGAIAESADAASKQQRRRRRRRRNRNQNVPPPPPPPPFVCPAAEICGTGCCSNDSCFAESYDPDDSTKITYNCCPAALVCKSQVPAAGDQCCYPDETCIPTLPNENPLVGICCRPCGGQCLEFQFECVNGEPELQTTARLPRYRR